MRVMFFSSIIGAYSGLFKGSGKFEIQTQRQSFFSESKSFAKEGLPFNSSCSDVFISFDCVWKNHPCLFIPFGDFFSAATEVVDFTRFISRESGALRILKLISHDEIAK